MICLFNDGNYLTKYSQDKLNFPWSHLSDPNYTFELYNKVEINITLVNTKPVKRFDVIFSDISNELDPPGHFQGITLPEYDSSDTFKSYILMGVNSYLNTTAKRDLEEPQYRTDTVKPVNTLPMAIRIEM